MYIRKAKSDCRLNDNMSPAVLKVFFTNQSVGLMNIISRYWTQPKMSPLIRLHVFNNSVDLRKGI